MIRTALAGVAVVLGFAAPAAEAATPAPTSPALVQELNSARQAHGLRALTPSRALERTAVRFSRQMVAEHFFDHRGFGRRTAGTGHRHRAENLAWTTSASPRGVVAQWLASPPHRANMLDPRFRHIGVGVASGTPSGTPGATVTAHFGD
jgi:uncharacterized protein YkwD